MADRLHDTEELFMRYQPLIRSIVSRYWRIYKDRIQSYQDLYQTASYLFLYALEIFKPEKGDLGSHIKRVISLKLNSMLRGEMAPRSSDRPFTFLRHPVTDPEIYS